MGESSSDSALSVHCPTAEFSQNQIHHSSAPMDLHLIKSTADRVCPSIVRVTNFRKTICLTAVVRDLSELPTTTNPERIVPGPFGR